MRVLHFPLSRITISFVLGIISAFYVQFPSKIIWILLILSFLICFVFYLKTKNTFEKNFSFGIAVTILSFLSGAATQIAHTETNQNSHYIHLIKKSDQEHLWKVVLKEKLKTTAKNFRYLCKVEQIDHKTCSGQILLNIKITSTKLPIYIGSRLLIYEKVSQINNNNPGGFDYKEYLSRKNIPAQIFTNTNHLLINSQPEKDLRYYAAQFRERCISTLQKKKFNTEELQLLNALLLGQQQDVSSDIIQDYQLAGAVHILSVSGLHIGFIMIFLELILKKLPKNQSGNIIRFIIIISGLWIYAIIAGLSPAVIRSATMFSFLSAGILLKRETNIFHTLLVSMLLILIFAPHFLFDAGFQLSYTALFFIVWLQPLFSKLWVPKNKIIDYFWKILTVSFAAQMGTLPLSLYYFHQFPGLFWLTNLLVLPAVGIIMAVGAIVLFFAAFKFAPDFLIWPLEKSINWLNQIIHYIASFENFIIRDIPLNFTILLILYGLIFSSILWFQKPSYKKLISTMSLIISLQLVFAFTKYNEIQKQELLVLHFQKKTLIAKVEKNQLTLLTPKKSLLTQSENLWLKNYRTTNYNPKTKFEKIQNIYFFKQKKILIIDSSGIFPKNGRPDILILIQSPKINLERTLQNLSPKIVIVDGSNSRKSITLWKETCLKRKIPFHATAEKGFYQVE